MENNTPPRHGLSPRGEIIRALTYDPRSGEFSPVDSEMPLGATFAEVGLADRTSRLETFAKGLRAAFNLMPPPQSYEVKPVTILLRHRGGRSNVS